MLVLSAFCSMIEAQDVNAPPSQPIELTTGPSSVKGAGFALKHDEKQYGSFLPVRKIEGSLPTSDLTIHENWLFAPVTGI